MSIPTLDESRLEAGAPATGAPRDRRHGAGASSWGAGAEFDEGSSVRLEPDYLVPLDEPEQVALATAVGRFETYLGRPVHGPAQLKGRTGRAILRLAVEPSGPMATAGPRWLRW